MQEGSMVESKKPATTGDVSKIIFSILDNAKDLNIIISEVNSELVGSPIEAQEEKDIAKKATQGWLEDNYRILCKIRGQMNKALEKMQLLKSRVACSPRKAD